MQRPIAPVIAAFATTVAVGADAAPTDVPSPASALPSEGFALLGEEGRVQYTAERHAPGSSSPARAISMGPPNASAASLSTTRATPRGTRISR